MTQSVIPSWSYDDRVSVSLTVCGAGLILPGATAFEVCSTPIISCPNTTAKQLWLVKAEPLSPADASQWWSALRRCLQLILGMNQENPWPVQGKSELQAFVLSMRPNGKLLVRSPNLLVSPLSKAIFRLSSLASLRHNPVVYCGWGQLRFF